MTREERLNIVNGGDISETNVENSEPHEGEGNEKVNVETSATESKAEEKGVSQVNEGNGATETPKTEGENGGKVDKKPTEKKQGLYNQTRAEHAFSKQTKLLNAARARIAELEKLLADKDGLKRADFVDKVSGKVDDDAYDDYRQQIADAKSELKHSKQTAEAIEDEREEQFFTSKCDEQLGEDAAKFYEYCDQVVLDDGSTRLDAFKAWLAANDGNGIVTSRINASKTGIKLLKHLMESKEARLSLLQTATPYQAEKVLDEIERGFASSGKEKPNAQEAKVSLSQMVSDIRQKQKPKLTPTGGAFGGQKSINNADHNTLSYRKSLLLGR